MNLKEHSIWCIKRKEIWQDSKRLSIWYMKRNDLLVISNFWKLYFEHLKDYKIEFRKK